MRFQRAAQILIVIVTATLLVWLAMHVHRDDGDEPARKTSSSERSETRGGVAARVTSGAAPESAPPGGSAAAAVYATGELQVTAFSGTTRIAGAEVHVYQSGGRERHRDPWRPVANGRTGEDGKLIVPTGPGLFLVSAASHGLARGFAEALRPAGERVTRVEVRLQPGSVVAGRTVEHGTREPVPLVTISLLPVVPGRLPVPRVPTDECVFTTSDEHGMFRVAGLAPGRWQLEASAPGHAPASTDIVVPHAEELRIELSGAAQIEGIVTRDGKPVAGATVLVTGSAEPVSVETGGTGGFAIEVDPGVHHVFARLGDETGSAGRAITVAAGRTVRGVEVQLGPAAAIGGHVRSGSGPIAGASVAASSHRERGAVRTAMTAADGSYELRGLAPGAYDVTVTAPPRGATSYGMSLRAGERFPLNVVLGDPTAIEGAVTDSSGALISGALVTASGGWSRRGTAGTVREVAAARTDAAGVYRLEDLAGGPLRVSARRDETSPASSRIVALEEGTTARVDLVLPDGGIATGTVRDARSNTVPGAVVATVGGGRGRQTTADAMGGYVLPLPVGTYGLTASRSDDPLRFGRRPTALATVTIALGVRTEIDLVLPDDRPDLIGRVLEPDGAPSPGAAIRVRASGSGTQLLNAGGDGTFALASGADGSAEVSARNGGRVGASTVTVPAEGVLVQLQPAATIQGRLVGDPPPETFTVNVSTTDAMQMGGAPSQLQFAGSTFSITDVAPGHVAFHAKTDDGRVGDAQASVAPGESRSVDVVLSPAAKITGRLVDAATGQPVTRGRIFVDGLPRRVAIGGDGRFSRIVSAGEHRIDVTAPGYGPFARTVTARADAPNDLGDVALTAPADQAAPAAR